MSAHTRTARGSRKGEPCKYIIRARYAAGGVTQSQLGREYGLTPQAAHDVIRGKSWRNVPQPGEQTT